MSAAPVTGTATPSTTTTVILGTSIPSPTTVTVTVILTSSIATPSLTCTTPDLSPTYTAVYANGFECDLCYSGSGYIDNTDNPGKDDPGDYPPLYNEHPGTLDVCDAVETCAEQSNNDPTQYDSFDLHYLCSNQTWICVQYYDLNDDASYFNVPDDDAVAVYGYNFV